MTHPGRAGTAEEGLGGWETRRRSVRFPDAVSERIEARARASAKPHWRGGRRPRSLEQHRVGLSRRSVVVLNRSMHCPFSRSCARPACPLDTGRVGDHLVDVGFETVRPHQARPCTTANSSRIWTPAPCPRGDRGQDSLSGKGQRRGMHAKNHRRKGTIPCGNRDCRIDLFQRLFAGE